MATWMTRSLGVMALARAVRSERSTARSRHEASVALGTSPGCAMRRPPWLRAENPKFGSRHYRTCQARTLLPGDGGLFSYLKNFATIRDRRGDRAVELCDTRVLAGGGEGDPVTTRLRPRVVLVPGVLAAVAALALPSLAVSDGGYDPAKQGCSSSADDSATPDHTEEGCYSATLQLAGASHRYVLVGVPQTPDGTSANAVEVCLDFTGTAKCARVDENGFTPLPDRTGTPIDPQSGELHAYFGADDNLDSGEHDGSTDIANGPSDGGAIQANLTPLTAAQWLAKA